eukprot:TRINITY_DN2572_c0_g1_i4.p1 TRINITY_DN2572_c0_g1~~TRINITY_DN2572_c0_g1_i4.p1  ORF type:complete len:135 (+),score=14.97 TRINITY_DN2572_c0_g1_i4:107-511(+)
MRRGGPSFRIPMQFHKANYWDSHYARSPEEFEWYSLSWPELKEFIAPYLTKEGKLLAVGCGNSKLTVEMYEDGYQNIVNSDFSSVVIDQMREKYSDLKMSWEIMDVRKLPCGDETFDFVLDKGCLLYTSPSPRD